MLVQDNEPDLESILVRPAGSVIAFAPQCFVAPGGQWEYQINLTGPVLDPTFFIPLQSDNKHDAPVNPGTQLTQNQMSASFHGGTIDAAAPGEEIITITATGRHVTKTARLRTSILH